MDWKRLVQFGLLGSSDLEQYAILLVRVSLGLFFAISGAKKLFVAGGTKTMYETLAEGQSPVSPPDDLFRVGCGVRWRILDDRGVSFEPGLHGFIGRYACRHPDHQAFRHA